MSKDLPATVLPSVSAAHFKQRRDRFLEQLADGAVAIIPATHEITRSNDTEYPFRQDRNFHYLTGFPEPDAIAVLRKGDAQPYTLFVRPRDREREIWTGYRAGPEGAMANYGADAAFDVASFPAKISELLRGGRPVYLQLGLDKALDGRIIQTIDQLRKRGRQGVEAPSGILDPQTVLAEMRLYKSADEIPLLEAACSISAAGHLAAMRETRPGMWEYEVQARIEYEFRRRGAAAPGYGSIVAGGANATVLHYVENNRKLEEGGLLLIDAGAEVHGYSGDITRTFPVGPRYEGAAKAVYELVLASQHAAIEICRPGETLESVHQAAVRVLTQGLVDLKILKGDIDGLIESNAFRPYYMHRTGHWLGLDVHDMGAYSLRGSPRPLEAGMCFTVEPGLYFHADSEAADEFKGIGVRIEDDLLITLKGNRVLTDAVPKDVAAIEDLRKLAFA